ncbi:ankyrin repeat-containing domain protein, partial [Baffinella frigidus]
PALWTASADGRVEDVRRLLAEGADIEGRGGPQQCTPLCAAAEGGHRVVSLILLFSAAEVSAKDIGGGTAMHYAASKGHAAVVLLLLEHGA